MSPETGTAILDKLDQVISGQDELRTIVLDLRARVASLEATREEADRTRAMRPARSPSFTNEIGEAVGSAVGLSMRAAAPDLARTVAAGSILRNVVAGALLALAILAAIVFRKE